MRDEEPPGCLLAGCGPTGPLVCGANQQFGGQLVEPVLELVVSGLDHLVRPVASLADRVPAGPLVGALGKRLPRDPLLVTSQVEQAALAASASDKAGSTPR